MEDSADNKDMRYITVYKMMPFDSFVKCLQEQGLKSSLPYSSANPMENLPWCTDEAELAKRIRKAKDYGCVLMSYTANYESPTMWGLYGDSGAGVCLEFRYPAVKDNDDMWRGQKVARFVCGSGENKRCYNLHKMEYSSKDTRMKRTTGKMAMHKLMLYKSGEWGFEKEYRFVVPMSWASSCHDGVLYYREPLCYLKAVYLGPLSPHSPNYLSSLIRLHLFSKETPFPLAEGTKHIPVRRAFFDSNRFAIRLPFKPQLPALPVPGETPPPTVPASRRKPKKSHKLLYMYASEKVLETILETWSLKASLTHAVNDPMECMSKGTPQSEPVEHLKRGGRAVYLCFSETVTSPSMWGNYAEGGKGACLVFIFPLVEGEDGYMELNKEQRGTCPGWENFRWRKVEYCDERAAEEEAALTFRKGVDWKYEREVRCFCDPLEADKAENGMLLYQLPMQFLAGVVLGPRSRYATPYIEKKLAQCVERHKKTTGNWPIANRIIPRILCSRARYSQIRYAFWAEPWFEGFSLEGLSIAIKLASASGLVNIQLRESADQEERKNINWEDWAELLKGMKDSEAKRIAAQKEERLVIQALLRYAKRNEMTDAFPFRASTVKELMKVSASFEPSLKGVLSHISQREKNEMFGVRRTAKDAASEKIVEPTQERRSRFNSKIRNTRSSVFAAGLSLRGIVPPQ